MKFKSQICTDIKQSRKLLELGLKKETADMWHYKDEYGWRCSPYIEIWDEEAYLEFGTPAWSLHRLIILLPVEVTKNGYKFQLRKDVLSKIDDIDNVYDEVIGVIQRVIEVDSFNKDYLDKK
jgi:hypothetical protein